MEKKTRNSHVWILITFALIAVAILLSYLFSSMHVDFFDTKKIVVGDASVKASDLQDENGKFIILDYPSNVDITKYVSLCDYKSLSVDSVELPEITEKDIDDNIISYIKYFERYDKITDGVVASDSIVTISYTGYLDGKALSSYTADRVILDLTDESLPSDFVSDLVGTTVDTDVEFDVVFADDLQDTTIAGKTVHFKAHVFNLNVIPTVTDDNVVSITNGEYQTLSDFREGIRQKIADYDMSVYNDTVTNEIMSMLVEKSQFHTIPQELINWYVSLQMKYYQDMADQHNCSVEEYIVDADIADSLDDLLYSMTESAVEMLPKYAVLTAIANAENITVDATEDADDISTREEQLMDGLGLSDVNVLFEYYKESNVLHDVLNWKTIDWLIENIQQVPSES